MWSSIGAILGIGLQIVQATQIKFTVSLKNTGMVVADFKVYAWGVLPGTFGTDWKTWNWANAKVPIPHVTIAGLSPGTTATATSAATTPIFTNITPGTYDMVYIAYLAAGGDPIHFKIKAGELVIVAPAPMAEITLAEVLLA